MHTNEQVTDIKTKLRVYAAAAINTMHKITGNRELVEVAREEISQPGLVWMEVPFFDDKDTNLEEAAKALANSIVDRKITKLMKRVEAEFFWDRSVVVTDEKKGLSIQAHVSYRLNRDVYSISYMGL